MTRGKETDYKIYHLQIRDYAIVCAVTIGLGVLVAFLFYDSPLGMLWMPCIAYASVNLLKSYRRDKRLKSLMKEFQDTMQMICTSLHAGASLENAFYEAEFTLKKEKGNVTIMGDELEGINRRIRYREPIETVLWDFGMRTGNEDIINLGEIIAFAKRGGGNLVDILETTIFRMREKWEITEEIDLVIAGKRLEQYIMDLVPLGILLYLRLSAGSYMQSLYHTGFGIAFMTACIGVYILALWISSRILSLSVFEGG